MDKLKEAPTPKGKERNELVISVALDLFLLHGYDDMRLDDVIIKIGGSKQSLYRYFGNKEKLFKAAMAHFSITYEKDLRNLSYTSDNKLEQFRTLADAILRSALSIKQLRFYRLLMGNSSRFPSIGEIWHQKGLQAVSNVIYDFLQSIPSLQKSSYDLNVLADALHGTLIYRLMNEAALLRQIPDEEKIVNTINITVEILKNFIKNIEK